MTTGRLAQVGFGFNTLTAGIEFDLVDSTPTIVTTSPRSGTYCGRASSLTTVTAQGFGLRHSVTAINEVYAQAAVKPATFPTGTATNAFFCCGISAGSGSAFTLFTDSAGNISGRYFVSGTTYNTFTTTGVLTANAWQVLEVHVFTAGVSASLYEVRLNGVTIGSATGVSMSTASQNYLTVGLNLNGEANTVGDFYFDDLVVSSGSGTWAGGVQVGYLFPNGDNGAHQWQTAGGTAGTTSNYLNVLDPTSTTTYIQSTLLNDHDTYTMSDSGLATGSTIDCVMAFVRAANNTATTNLGLKLEVVANGSTNTSSQWTPNSTTPSYRNGTNVFGIAFPATTTLFNDPSGAAWTPANLDAMTIGLLETLDSSTNFIRVNAVWASYTYIPAAPPAGTGLLEFMAAY